VSENDIIAPPPILAIYAWLRSLITPNQNGKYLIIESVSVGLLVATIGYIYYNFTLITAFITAISFIIVSLLRYLLIAPDNRDFEQKVFKLTFKQAIVIQIVASLPISTYHLFQPSVNPIPITLSIFVYILSIYWRSTKYLGEREYFTDLYSNTSEDWYMGSVSLEQAFKHLDKDNTYRGYYWAYKAEKHYENIFETENRQFLREAASEFHTAAMFLSCIFYLDSVQEINAYNQAATQSFKRGAELLRYRVCDTCKSKTHIGEASRIISENGKRFIRCNRCEKEYENQSQKHYYKTQNNKSNKTESNSDNPMTEKEACNHLNIEYPANNIKEIRKSYREKVKQTHPDMGGSNDEFIKTKQARDTLLNSLNK